MRLRIILAGVVLCGTALAQTSTSFTLEEYTLNSGGTPSQGVDLTSTSFSITLTSIGDGVVAAGLSSASFEADVGFDAAYPPPGEVAPGCGASGAPCLQFTNSQTLTWPAEPSAGIYNLYRDDISNGFGDCEEQDIAGTTTTDTAIPTTAFFYLATVKNRLAEEGTKGFQSNATERLGAVDLPVCP